MDSVRRVLPLLDMLVVEASEISCEGVPIQEQDEVSVDLPDRFVQTIAELDKTCVWVLRVVWLWERPVGDHKDSRWVASYKNVCSSGRWRRVLHGPSANLYFDHRERHADQGYGVNAVSGADVDHPIEVLD